MLFFVLGVCLKEYNIIERVVAKLSVIGGVSGLCLIIVTLYEGYKNGIIDCVSNTFGLSMLLFYMNASVLSISFILLCRIILNRENTLARNISDGTLLILSLHYVMISPLKGIFGNWNWGFIAISLIIMAVCTLMILACRRWFPVLIGKWK